MSRVALIHAVREAMQPIEKAFSRLWPDAERVNLLDDSLSADRAKKKELSLDLFRRIEALGNYARSMQPDAILFTCSAFGPAIEAVRQRSAIPVLKPNEAMFEAAMQLGHVIGLIATFEPAVAPMEQEFRELTPAKAGLELTTICVPEAFAALRKGDEEAHDRIVAEAALRLSRCDALMLAHFSTSRAASAVRRITKQPVLASPDAAVIKLRSLVEGKDGSGGA